jgi:hypothetical protein
MIDQMRCGFCRIDKASFGPEHPEGRPPARQSRAAASGHQQPRRGRAAESAGAAYPARLHQRHRPSPSERGAGLRGLSRSAVGAHPGPRRGGRFSPVGAEPGLDDATWQGLFIELPADPSRRTLEAAQPGAPRLAIPELGTG